jgi:transposase
MGRFRAPETGPLLLPVDLSCQLSPGTFAHALHYLLDHKIDLRELEARYRNDCVGAPAYAPRVLLKIVLLAYCHGIVSSRKMEWACRNIVQFMAISGNSQPDYSTLASFVSGLGDMAGKVFTQVLLICLRQGLIGREMFAIDGVKLPSNASKAKSGKRKDFVRQLGKMRKAVEQLLSKQREADASSAPGQLSEREQRRMQRMKREADQIEAWLKQHPQERNSAKGKVRLSNRTDNESAKMPTNKGVVQGYTGVAAVDEKHQVIVAAQAHGSGSEQELLAPITEALEHARAPDTVMSADSGYYSKSNLKDLEARGIDAFIPDNGYRKRDQRYEGQDTHKAKPDALWDKSLKAHKPKHFRPEDFQVAKDLSHCICPAGKRLYRSGTNCNIGGRRAVKFKGAQRDCKKCPLRAQCLRYPQRTQIRQVAIFTGKHAKAPDTAADRMKRKIDTERGREMIGRRFATVEPVFGNLRANKKLNRFTLRGKAKVDAQWKLYCLVHNIEKLAHNGYAR